MPRWHACPRTEGDGQLLSAGHVLRQNDSSEQIILSFEELLPQPDAVIGLNFTYTLRPGLEGLYRSQFTGRSADQKWSLQSSPALQTIQRLHHRLAL